MVCVVATAIFSKRYVTVVCVPMCFACSLCGMNRKRSVAYFMSKLFHDLVLSFTLKVIE